MKPRLGSLLPVRLAQECSADGFVNAVKAALTTLAEAETAPAAAASLVGLAAGPLAFVGVYAGAAVLQWKRDKNAQEHVKAQFLELKELIQSVENGSEAQRKLTESLTKRLDQNTVMVNQLMRAEKRFPDEPDKAAAAAVADLLKEIGGEITDHIDVIESNLCVYLDTLKFLMGEVKEDITEIRSAIPGLATKETQDAQGKEIAEIKQMLAQALDTKQQGLASGNMDLPEVDPATRAAADRMMQSPEASLLDRVNAAVLRRDDEAEDLLDELDRLTEIADYTRHQRRGDYHYYRGEYDAAIEPYEKALQLRPNDLTARNNAAIAHSQARLGNTETRQLRAIEIYTDTLDIYTKDDHPAQWAMTQNNIANAWGSLPTGDKTTNITKAIEHYNNALTIYTKDDHPADWAMTQNNIAIALADLADLPGQDRCDLLRKSIACSKGALSIRTVGAMPHDHAETQHNLAIDREAYEAAGCQPPFDEIQPVE